MARLPLGKQQYRAFLTGMANPLKGLIPEWDEALSIYNGCGYVCYQSETTKIEKCRRIKLPDIYDENDIPFENLEADENAGMVDSPTVNNRFVRVYYQFKPNPKLQLPEEYKFAINPNEYFQWSKQKCSDMDLSFEEDKLSINFLNEDGTSILNQSTSEFSKDNFNRHKDRYQDFVKRFWESGDREVFLIQEETELSPEDIDNMTKKHCILYYNKANQFKTVSDQPIFFCRQKYQVRLDKNLFPKFTKTDKIKVELRTIKGEIEKNIPESFILRFNIDSKQYSAIAFISCVCCL